MADPAEQLELDWGEGPQIRVVPARLTLLRVAIGQRQAGLARSLATSRTSVGNWEKGLKQPTQFLGALADQLEVSPIALTLPAERRVSSGPHFRSKSVALDRQLDRAIAVAELVSEVAEYLDKRVGLDLNDSLAFELPPHPQRAAVEIRKLLGVPEGPIANMVRFAKDVGVIAAYTPKLMRSIDAYSVHAGRRPLILMTPKGDYYRHRWDVAHELGHLFSTAARLRRMTTLSVKLTLLPQSFCCRPGRCAISCPSL